MIDPERPALRVREHPVDPRQDQVGRDIADHLRIVLDVLEARVAGPAVADDRAAGRDVAGDEAAECGGRVVADHREPDPTRPLALDLDRAGDRQLALVRPPGPDRLGPRAKGAAGLVALPPARPGPP